MFPFPLCLVCANHRALPKPLRPHLAPKTSQHLEAGTRHRHHLGASHNSPPPPPPSSAPPPSSGTWCSGAGKGRMASHLQIGHSGLRDDSHWSMHSTWKRCLHGSTRSFSPSLIDRQFRAGLWFCLPLPQVRHMHSFSLRQTDKQTQMDGRSRQTDTSVSRSQSTSALQSPHPTDSQCHELMRQGQSETDRQTDRASFLTNR
jgi:hypothetical protein